MHEYSTHSHLWCRSYTIHCVHSKIARVGLVSIHAPHLKIYIIEYRIVNEVSGTIKIVSTILAIQLMNDREGHSIPLLLDNGRPEVNFNLSFHGSNSCQLIYPSANTELLCM